MCERECEEAWITYFYLLYLLSYLLPEDLSKQSTSYLRLNLLIFSDLIYLSNTYYFIVET